MKRIEVVEVGPRDGLQNEARLVSSADKIELIRRSIAAGARRIEVASFVNPRKVPQMADAETVVAGLGPVDGVTRIGLVLNERGAERALACGIDQLGAVAVASDAFGMRNQGQTCDESVEVAARIIEMAQRAGRSAQATIAVAFGCPFSGGVDPALVVAMARRLSEAGAVEIALADTVGVAVPAEVSPLVSKVRQAIGRVPVRVHFHDTRNTGIANVWAAVEAGARTVDAALGGLGGCPFAPGAAGNVGTEDVVHLLERSGISTGLNVESLLQASRWLGEVMEKAMPSKLAQSGPGPLLEARR
ncbi:MAG: hydroxymethylglutaryl-CoA lyase [Tsuneonella sp.]